MRRRHAFLAVASLVAGLVAVVGGPAAPSNAFPSNCCFVALTDQKNHKIWITDQTVSTKKFEFPKAGDPDPSGWYHPSDVRLRQTTSGSAYMAVSDTSGFVGLIPYPAFTGRKWSLNLAGTSPHAIEMFPNGDVALALTSAGQVRVYNTRLGASSTTYASVPLRNAHGLMYQKSADILWALGDATSTDTNVDGRPMLLGYRVTFTSGAPVFTLKKQFVLTSAAKWSHDLQPVFASSGPTGYAWVTSNLGAYEVNLSSGSFIAAPLSTQQFIKSYQNNPSVAGNQLMYTVGTQECNTADPAAEVWCDNNVHLVDLTTGAHQEKAFAGGMFYKARYWTYEYE